MSEESSLPSPPDGEQPAPADLEKPEPALDSSADHPVASPAGECSQDIEQQTAGKTPPARRAPDSRESTSLQRIRRALRDKTSVEGKVIGWNNGGFHVVAEGLTAFCPRSEMEIGQAKAPEGYLDQTFRFRPLRIQKKGRRIVLSRAAELKAERARLRAETRKSFVEGAVLQGKVASLTDFGAFVDLGGGVQGLIHVSEISRERISQPSEKLAVGQEVRVKVRKLEKGGKRISLSMRALEPDPWQGILKRYPRGSMVRGKVEKATDFGAFIQLEPGLTGLLPTSAMSIPRETTPARVYPPGKEVEVQIVSIDPRRHRISLAPEGSALEGSRLDYKDYIKSQQKGGPGTGFNALASALRKLQRPAD